MRFVQSAGVCKYLVLQQLGQALKPSTSGLSVRYGSLGIGNGGGALRSHPVGYALLILNIYTRECVCVRARVYYSV